jgi:NAD+ diphosphatase
MQRYEQDKEEKMFHAEAINLPFNNSVIKESYAPAKPGEMKTEEPGHWVIVQEDNVVFHNGAGRLSLFHGESPHGLTSGGEQILIGRWKGEPLRLLRIGKNLNLPPEFIAEPLLFLFFKGEIEDELLTIAGLAQQMARWEKNSAACPLCGKETDRISGTWGKRCLTCGNERFPSVYPCVVVLVERGDSLLMIRKREWPQGYYSLPSGFCDFGECLEECVVREVEEETGIRVNNIRYRGSQSWPFPSQLMTAFTAQYESGRIAADLTELEDARWFRKNSLPPTFSSKSIAGWLIERFGNKAGPL